MKPFKKELIPRFEYPRLQFVREDNWINLNKRKEWIQGFCYTQLYDQFQEVNGLLTFDREPKFLPSKLREVVDKMFY